MLKHKYVVAKYFALVLQDTGFINKIINYTNVCIYYSHFY
jgi:hypothetical protein